MKYLITLLLFSLSFSLVASDITETELLLVQKGELVLKEEKVKDAPWPVVTIFSMIDAPVEEASAIFSAYDRQKDFVPKVLSATPVKHVTPTDVHMAYVMAMPWPFSDTHYTTGNILTKVEPAGYQVSWYFVKSDSTVNNKGFARFTPLGDKTLFHYQTFVHPDSIFAGLLKGKMKGDVQKTIEAIVKYINVTTKNNRELVSKLIQDMHRSLNGENIYADRIK